jgi:DNA-binding MarR family transcriptional regulator
VSKDRSELLEEIRDAFRRNGQGQDAMDSAAAHFFGIHRTDLSLLDVLQLGGRMTAGELAKRGNLSPGAVTAALDRLEGAGYVRRVRDEVDRRRVFVEVTDEMLRRAGQVYGPLAARSEELLGSLTDEQLRVIIGVLRRGAEMQLERAAALREELDGGQGSTTR